jgi:hypothetical protein
MKNLFYSPSEKILFWITGCPSMYGNVSEFIKIINEDAEAFSDYTQVPFNSICFDRITEGRRYKFMMTYWVEDQTIKANDADDTFIHNGKEVFNIGKRWTMREWIEC